LLLLRRPPHSIAVLPFVNMSGDASQEYFSDGLTEEILNSLSRINELQVAARTSAFSFKGKDTDIGTIARKLNVGAVLEGSVRRSAHTVRITAQLINAVTGFHLWSQTYDRNLGDILALQTEIANAVASGLKVSLLGDVAAKIELGGTHDAGAFDAYLRASKAYRTFHDRNGIQTAISEYSEAIRLDPQYALAFAGRSIELITYANEVATTEAAIRDSFDKAQADARKALALAPDLAEGHLALARFFFLGSLDFTGGSTSAPWRWRRAMLGCCDCTVVFLSIWAEPMRASPPRVVRSCWIRWLPILTRHSARRCVARVSMSRRLDVWTKPLPLIPRTVWRTGTGGSPTTRSATSRAHVHRANSNPKTS
jgi:TolB-like protein